jgi:hypothetical protein
VATADKYQLYILLVLSLSLDHHSQRYQTITKNLRLPLEPQTPIGIGFSLKIMKILMFFEMK